MTDSRLLAEVRSHPHSLMFVTVSGAHLYGFPSVDSDYDLRGAHILPIDLLTGLAPVVETVKRSHEREGLEVDLVTHEVRKFMRLLLRDNGYVLEQLYSPLVVRTTPAHAELKAIARGCITRTTVRHYLGFAQNQWLLYQKDSPRRVKALLYVFRVLLSGIFVMRTGEVNANIMECNRELALPYIDALVAHKGSEGERATLRDADDAFYEREYHRLRAELIEAADRSALPIVATASEPLADLLRRVRRSAESLG